MTAITIGNLTVPDAGIVYMLRHYEYSARLFDSARWEIVAELTHGSHIVIDDDRNKESACAKFANYATKLGLHVLSHGCAVRRSNIVATFVTKTNGAWRVVLRFNVGLEDFEHSLHDYYANARASLDTINSKLFTNSTAAEAAATPQ
jgi:hypothetical protein